MDSIVSKNIQFAGFNLLLLAPRHLPDGHAEALSFDAAFVTNSGGGGPISARGLSDPERHCGGMSNGIDQHGASYWPKIQHGTRMFSDVLDSLTEDVTDLALSERLFDLLACVST